MADPHKDVNNLLHVLRGEQYRHAQNVRGSHARLSLSPHLHNARTLPAGVASITREETQTAGINTSAPLPPPGPRPPKSWQAATTARSRKAERVKNSPLWRAQALELVYSHLSPAVRIYQSDDTHSSNAGLSLSVPPLTLICLRDIITTYSAAEFAAEIIPYIPLHLRRQILFDSAIHAPLPNAKLYLLCEPSGYVQDELVIVGPFSTLKPDSFDLPNRAQLADPQSDDISWESPLHDEWTARPLHTLILLSASISVSQFLDLPVTLTHLALIDLAVPIPLYRLTVLCPHLIVLDLSYNKWLDATSAGDSPVLERVQWRRWRSLRVLGLRECAVGNGFLAKVNKGRWDDVEVVLHS